jgi:hypothetical protein
LGDDTKKFIKDIGLEDHLKELQTLATLGPDGQMGYPREQQLEYMNLNFGPNHPAAHGVLRLMLMLEGEVLIGRKDFFVGI